MNTITLLLFTALNCEPCGKLAEELTVLPTALEQSVTVKAVFPYQDLDTAEHYNITVLPTMILLDKNGKELSRRIGFLKEETIENWIQLIILH